METVRYSPIAKEDCSFGSGSFEVTLADGRVVSLSQIDIGTILSTAGLSTQTLTNLTLSTGCSWAGTAIPILYGGTGSTTALAALQALGAMMNKVTAKAGNYTVVAADMGLEFAAGRRGNRRDFLIADQTGVDVLGACLRGNAPSEQQRGED